MYAEYYIVLPVILFSVTVNKTMRSLCFSNKSPKMVFTNTQLLTTSMKIPGPANQKTKGGRCGGFLENVF